MAIHGAGLRLLELFRQSYAFYRTYKAWISVKLFFEYKKVLVGYKQEIIFHAAAFPVACRLTVMLLFNY